MELKRLIEDAQNGDERAKNELVTQLRSNGAMQQLSRYLYTNRLVSPKDVQGEFWLGVAEGMVKVKHDIGNPIQYLIQRGLWQVASALRKTISKEVVYFCTECGKSGQLRRREDIQFLDIMKCPKCGGDIDTEQRFSSIGEKNFPDVKQHRIERMSIDEFKGMLTSRERDVVELMVNGTNRDTSKGYIKDMATHLNISTHCTNIYLSRIRVKLREHMEKIKSEQ